MNENQIWDALEEVYDPELGVDIVNLGLVYAVDTSDKAVALTITLTSAGCPLKDVMEADIQDMLKEETRDIQFYWTFYPAWTPAMMTDLGKEEIRTMGGYIPEY